MNNGTKHRNRGGASSILRRLETQFEQSKNLSAKQKDIIRQAKLSEKELNTLFRQARALCKPS